MPTGPLSAAPATHFCPNPDGRYRGWAGWGNLRAHGCASSVAATFSRPCSETSASEEAQACPSTTVKPRRAAFFRSAVISRARGRRVYSSGLRSRNGVRWMGEHVLADTRDLVGGHHESGWRAEAGLPPAIEGA